MQACWIDIRATNLLKRLLRTTILPHALQIKMHNLLVRRVVYIPSYQRTIRLFSSPYNYSGKVFKENLKLNNIFLIQKCSFGFKNKPPKNSRALKTRQVLFSLIIKIMQNKTIYLFVQAAAKRFTKTGGGTVLTETCILPESKRLSPTSIQGSWNIVMHAKDTWTARNLETSCGVSIKRS